MTDSPEDSPTLTVETTENYDALSPAVMTGIMVSFGIGLFTICAVVYWIWKKMAEDLEDKCMLVEHDNQTSDSSEKKNGNRNDQVSKTEGTDNVAVSDKIAENNSQVGWTGQDGDKVKEKYSSIGVDSLCSITTAEMTVQDLVQFPSEDKLENTVCSDGQDECLGSTTGNPKDLDCDHTRTKESHHVVSQTTLEDVEVLSSCDLPSEQVESVRVATSTEKSTNSEVNNIDKLPTFKDTRPEETGIYLQHPENKTVQVGPSFTGNLSISPSMIDMHKNLRTGDIAAKVELQEKLNSCNEDNKLVGENQNKVILQGYVSEHKPCISINCQGTKSSDNNLEVATRSATVEPVSPSLQYLTESNKPKDDTDGSWLSKHDDMFMFQQDNDVSTTVNQPEICPKLQSQTNTKLKKIVKQDLTISKSLDSQVQSLQKGCQLLETKPFKSSFRKSGSDGCLKKYVHFPEDIRNIRVVHKYDSFDDKYDGIWLNIHGDKSEEETKGDA